uniref:Uncharacterized protein n=1 Tax=Anguilla anguilla TaxID=7936 RepID=A0A0E9QD79_ANGAN
MYLPPQLNTHNTKAIQ